MPVIREVATRKASLDEIATYLIEGGNGSPGHAIASKFTAPKYRAGELVYVLVRPPNPSDVQGRAGLITAVAYDSDDILRYTVRYADDQGYVREVGDIQEDGLGRTLRPSPEDKLARAVTGDTADPNYVWRLSWLRSLFDVALDADVRKAYLAGGEDRDDAYDEMIDELMTMSAEIREYLADGLTPEMLGIR